MKLSNDIIQGKKMNLLVRYWRENVGKVCTIHIDSNFLKRTYAQGPLDELLHAIKPLISQRLVQLSTDGPNTSKNVFGLLTHNYVENEYPGLRNPSYCSPCCMYMLLWVPVRIWSHLLKKSFLENFVFCLV